MKLDEAIIHAEEVAQDQEMKADFETDNENYKMSESEREECRKCAAEHRLLAEWLKELREYRKRDCESCINSKDGKCAADEVCHSCMWESQYKIKIDDCISRKAVINILKNSAEYGSWDDSSQINRLDAIDNVDMLPSVIPSYNSIKTELKPCEDCVSREYLIDKIGDVDGLEKYDNSNLFAKHYMNLVRIAPSVIPQTDVLDKIIDEIRNDWQLNKYPASPFSCGLRRAMYIIDKYIEGNEER